jgi:thiol:disulfide interchange protein/DsbC/DsbD-like thiol-disulfide interchange protein
LIYSIYTYVRILRTAFVTICLGLCISSARAAHTQAQLLLADDSARPGDTVLAGVHLKMEPGWHTYWKNPGAAGMSTKIQWELPPGVTASEIEWPVPEKIPPDEIITYGYENEVMLLVPLKLGADLKPGPLELKAKVSWLECKEQCIPAGGDVQATLTVGNETKPSRDAALIELWKQKTPRTDKLFSFEVQWEKSIDNDTRTLIIQGFPTGADTLPIDKVDFFPDASDQFEIQGATEKVTSKIGFALRKTLKKFSGDWPAKISGVIVIEGNGHTNGFALNEPITATGATPASVPAAAPMEPAQSLPQMLLYAFIGGLILNIMPCVLPVIALKILGFVSEAANDRRKLRKLGFIYLLGVLVSFLTLGIIVVALKAAGSRVGWGFQFNNPYFLVIMTALVTVIALNLFGVFEITLGGRTMNAAVNLSSRRGAAGAFFNGLLATVLATSCTAPYLGSAVGFAFARPPGVIILFLLTVGLGLAFPYVVLSWEPAWLKFLPKPGVWMERFKVAMGFPMLGAAVWLCSLLSTFYGERTWALAIFLVILALAVWVYGQFVQRSTKYRGLSGVIVALLLLLGYFYALEGQLRWREPIADTKESQGSAMSAVTPSGGTWQEWTPEAVAKARSEGRPVLVDFTAKWCLTCQKDVKPVLESHAVQDKLKELNAVALVGDYTRFPTNIFDELARHGRAGVPLVLVYSKDGTSRPQVLPEAVTRGIVLNALDKAAK